jgi:site-specific DNA-cytosine methylase
MEKSKIKYAPIIPLIGGFPLGAEKAIGHSPEFIASYNIFAQNDQHYVFYQNEVLKRNISYHVLDKNDKPFKTKLHITVSTPPCAALSLLNCGKKETVKGAKCAKNEWMLISSKHAIENYDADVVIGENAPMLFTEKGELIAQKLYELAKQYDYSLTLYKTSTLLHGIPQKRDRTFYILWKSKTAPILNWYDLPCKTFKEYLSEVKEDSLYQNIEVSSKVKNEPFFMFLKYKYGGLKEARKILLETQALTALTFVRENNLLNEAKDFFYETNHLRGIHVIEYLFKKTEMNKGVWDGSVKVYKDHMNACISRNMVDTLHPTYNRAMTIREVLHMMGFPSNFQLTEEFSRKFLGWISQNVPVPTAKSIVEEAIAFLQKKRKLSDSNFVRQNNLNKTISFHHLKENNSFSLENFIA